MEVGVSAIVAVEVSAATAEMAMLDLSSYEASDMHPRGGMSVYSRNMP